MFQFLPLLFLLTSLPALLLADCPPGAFQYPPTTPAKCYFSITAPKSFSDAEDFCKKNVSGHLSSIHDAYTNTILSTQAEFYFHGISRYFWIGANTLSGNGNYTWTDGSPTDFNDFGHYKPTGKCGEMSEADGYWNFANCSTLKPFFCQISDDSFAKIKPFHL